MPFESNMPTPNLPFSLTRYLLVLPADDIKFCKTSGLNWIQTVWYSDGIPENFSKKLIKRYQKTT